MEFAVTPELYTLDGVNQHLPQLKHLKKLRIDCDYSIKETEMNNLMVHSAGKVPNLQSFSYVHEDCSSDSFVKTYAELYPHKKLKLIRVQ
jgi:hypothetical protein